MTGPLQPPVDPAQLGLSELVKRISDGYMERTPSGGIHLFYRCTASKSEALARRPATPEELAAHPTQNVKVLIETKGEGGYAVIAPSRGKVHTTGEPWVLEQGGFSTIATISEAERAELLRLARSFDRMPVKAPVQVPQQGAKGARPGDVFNERATWGEVLAPKGWSEVKTVGGVTYWRRPGKSEGVSATTGHGGRDLLHVFTTSTELDAEKSYEKFTVYAILNHGGDFGAAASALDAQGYRTTVDTKGPEPDEVLARVQRELLLVPDDRPDFYDRLVDEDGLADLPEQEWLIDGWVPKGGYSIIFGPAGTGKTLVLLGMAKGVSRGKRWQKAQCRRGAVLFLEGEGLGQLRTRSAAWDQAYPRTGQEVGIQFSDLPLDLTRPEGVAEVIRTVEKMQANSGTSWPAVPITDQPVSKAL